MKKKKNVIKEFMAIKKNNEYESERLTKQQTRFVLRARTLTQSLRYFVPLFIRENAQQLKERRKIEFHLAPILENLNGMFEANKCGYLDREEIQVAVNSVLSSSKCPVVDWDGDAYVIITYDDAKRINSYISSIQALSSEKEFLGISEVDESYFSDIL